MDETTAGHATESTTEMNMIALFQNRNYKVRMTGIASNTMTAISTIHDTGAGPNIIHKLSVDPDRYTEVKPMCDAGITAATKWAL